MKLKIKGLSLVLLLSSILASAADSILPFPAEGCSSAWNGVSPQNYLFDFKQDPTPDSQHISTFNSTSYSNYIDRMLKSGLVRKECHKTWTVLVFMTATKDLLPYAYADLKEIEANITSQVNAGSTIRSDVLVQLNSELERTIRRIHMFTNPEDQFQNITKDDLQSLSGEMIHSPIISISEKNFAETEANRLENFLKWGMEEFPSEHYLLVIWGHGKFNYLAVEPGGSLDTESLKSVLEEVNVWSDDRLDVLAADSCYWMAVDDLEKVSKVTQYVCGSSDMESYAGFPYGALLRHLNSGKFDGARVRASNEELAYGEPYLVAWMIPQLYQESFYTPTDPSGDSLGGSQSSLDPNAVCDLTGCSISSKHLRTALIPSINHLGEALITFIEEGPERWMDLKSLIDQGPFYQDSTQDLGLFLKGVVEIASTRTTPASAKLLRAAAETRRALNYTVVNAVLGENYPKFDSRTEYGPRGLAIWLPRANEDFITRLKEFKSSPLYSAREGASAPGWGAWMKKMYL